MQSISGCILEVHPGTVYSTMWLCKSIASTISTMSLQSVPGCE
jgi:hypothetical protein